MIDLGQRKSTRLIKGRLAEELYCAEVPSTERVQKQVEFVRSVLQNPGGSFGE